MPGSLTCSLAGILGFVIRSAHLRALPRRADGPGAFRLYLGNVPRTAWKIRLRGSPALSTPAVSAIAAAIQTQEGYSPGTLAYTNNNPGNLVYAGQTGASPGAGGFASFPSYAAGYQAMVNQIQLDATRGTDAAGNPTTTIAQLITSWAPPSENNTAAYINSVASQTGFDPNAPLSSLGVPSSAGAFTLPAGLSSDSDSSDSSITADLSDLSGSVDLSSLGGPSDVSTALLVGAAALVGLLIFSRL